jgi:hypothetical protein
MLRGRLVLTWKMSQHMYEKGTFLFSTARYRAVQ